MHVEHHNLQVNNVSATLTISSPAVSGKERKYSGGLRHPHKSQHPTDLSVGGGINLDHKLPRNGKMRECSYPKEI